MLKKILSELKELEEGYPHFDLRFFVATFAGYGMHHACMLNTSEFSVVVDKFLKKSERLDAMTLSMSAAG
jgi:hypothetical protein